MSSIFRVITVNITRQTKPIPQAGFGVIAIIGENSSSGNRIDFYTDLSGVEGGLDNGTADPEYDSAASAFSQSPKPTKVAIIHVDYPTESYTDALNDAVDVNDTFYGVVDVSRDEVIQEEVSDWVGANNRVLALSSANVDIINKSDSQDSLNNCTITFAGDLITANEIDITVNALVMPTETFDTDHATTMANIVTALDGLTDVTATINGTHAIDLEYTAAPISIDNAVVTLGASQTTISTQYASIAAQLKAKAADRTMGFYHGSATTEYIDSGALGKFLTWQPGTYTPAYKTITGSSTDNLTEGKATNAHDKYFNTYEELGGVNSVLFGYVSSGEDFDIIVFQDWLRSRIAENVYSLLANTKKVAFTDPDITKIETRIMEILEIALGRKAITPFAYDPVTGEQIGGYKIWMPQLADIPVNDKANHILRDVKFKCWYSNAIHTVIIDGTITI